jgi:hypothetical protein
MSENKKSFKYNDQTFDIPVAETQDFLKDFPGAEEIKSFVVNKDTFDIPVAKVPEFKQDMPNAKPLYKEEKKGFWDSYFGDLTQRIASGVVGGTRSLINMTVLQPAQMDIMNRLEEEGVADLGMRKMLADAQVDLLFKPVVNAVDELKLKRDELREKSDRYKGKDFTDLWKEGDKAGAVGEIFLTASESLPLSLIAMFGGGLGLTVVGGIAGSEKYERLEDVGLQDFDFTKATPEEIEKNRQLINEMSMDQVSRLVNSSITGISEALTERIGSVPIGRWLKGVYGKVGKDVAEKQIKKGLGKWVGDIFNKYGIVMAPFSEGAEEYVNQIAENITDYATGVTDVFDPLKDANKSFVYGTGGGAQFTMIGAPGVAYNKFAQKKARKNAEKTVTENVNALSNEDGTIHQATDREGNLIFIKSETPGVGDKTGTAVVIDANGQPRTMDVADIEDRQILQPGEVIGAQMGQFEAEQQQSKQPETFVYDGKTYIFRDYMSENNEPVVAELDETGAVVGEDVILDEEFISRIESQLMADPETEPEIRTVTVGKKEYTLKKAEDAFVSDPFNTEEEALKVQSELQKSIGKKNSIEVVSQDSGDPLVPDSYQVVVKPITEEALVEELDTDLQEQKEEIEAPSYRIGEKEVDRDYVEEFIDLADTKEELEGLTVNNDPEILELIDNKFPEPVTSYKIGKKEVTPARARARIELAKTAEQLEELKITADPELEELYKKRQIEFEAAKGAKELTKEDAKHNRLVQLVSVYNKSSPVKRKRIDTGAIMKLASDFGYTVEDERGKLLVTDNGKKITTRSERVTTAMKEVHNALTDYDEAFQKNANKLMEVRLVGTDVGMAQKEVDKAIEDIKEGKNSVGANKLLDAIKVIKNE